MAITNGYTSLSAIKARLGITDTDDDAVLEAIVTGVSRAIDDACGRRFYAATQTRYYTARRGDRLFVDDLLSVTTLKTDDDGDRTYENTWAATDYDLMPYNAQLESTPRPYWELRVTPEGDYSFPVGAQKGVEIVGSWGFASATPAVIEQACLHQSALEYQAKDAPLGTQGSGEFQQEVRAIGLHPFTRKMLEPYRVVRIA